MNQWMKERKLKPWLDSFPPANKWIKARQFSYLLIQYVLGCICLLVYINHGNTWMRVFLFLPPTCFGVHCILCHTYVSFGVILWSEKWLMKYGNRSLGSVSHLEPARLQTCIYPDELAMELSRLSSISCSNSLCENHSPP